MSASNTVPSITTGRGDVALLRAQRDWLLATYPADDAPEQVDGLVNLLDHLLDAAEGFDWPRQDSASAQSVPMDFHRHPIIKPGIAATRFYVVVAESDGDVATYEIAPTRVERIGAIAVENQGEGAERIWHAAADALAAVMPEDKQWAALGSAESSRRQTPPVT